MTLIVLALAIVWQFVLSVRAKKVDRPFHGLLLFSAIYFCGGGYFYWVFLEDSFFAGVQWDRNLVELSVRTLAIATAATATMASFLAGQTKRRLRLVDAKPCSYPLSSYALLLIGLASSALVVVFGFHAEGERSAFALVVYQFSDLLIGVLIFRVAVGGFTKVNAVMLAYFVVYASYVGFRYKLALLAFPLIVMVYMAPISRVKKYLGLLGAGVVVLTSFAILTLLRDKFNGLNLAAASEVSGTAALYGFFAESNILFGLSSIIQENANAGNFVYLRPIVDAAAELVPRFLYPDRSTGDYLEAMRMGFYTDEGIGSGTAYPYIGEFGMMFGWAGIVAGALAYGAIYVYIRNKLLGRPIARNALAGGLGLLVAIMGYYQYSRGYFPQMLKAYLFVLVPYWYLLRQVDRRWSQRPNSTSPRL